jgi:hypothetical protein
VSSPNKKTLDIASALKRKVPECLSLWGYL